MNQIVFATNNRHKLAEVREILGGRFSVLSLSDIGCDDDIPETGSTFEENALQKARWVKERYGYDCFADDSGLEVDSLGGAPGVFSARYAGGHGDDSANNARLLNELSGKSDRHARFRCAIAVILDDETRFFSGSVEGEILAELHGEGGFGYDPLFRPDGWQHSFAEATPVEKHAVSHRGNAVRALAQWLLSK